MSIWSRKTTLVIAAALLIVPAGYAASAPHRRAGRSVRRDFVVGRLPRSAFPITLPGRRSGRTGRPVPTTRTLTALGLRTLPWVGMRDLAAANQDACKGARLRLRFSGSARKAGRAR
jgi:hypothetical protein